MTRTSLLWLSRKRLDVRMPVLMKSKITRLMQKTVDEALAWLNLDDERGRKSSSYVSDMRYKMEAGKDSPILLC